MGLQPTPATSVSPPGTSSFGKSRNDRAERESWGKGREALFQVSILVMTDGLGSSEGHAWQLGWAEIWGGQDGWPWRALKPASP